MDPGDIYFIEAIEGGSRVRLRGARPLIDVRLAGELERALAPLGFVRVHRDYLVNIRRVREVRRRPTGRDWELKLSSRERGALRQRARWETRRRAIPKMDSRKWHNKSCFDRINTGPNRS